MKKITFTMPITGHNPVQVTGYAFEYQGIQMVVHRMMRMVAPFEPIKNGSYQVSEVSTGMYVTRFYEKTIADAKKESISRIEHIGVDKTKAIIEKMLKAKP